MDVAAAARQGWREFRARPCVSAVAVVTLALGVGGATTMFAMLRLVSAQMIPPGVDPARVGRIVWLNAGDSGARGPLTGEQYAELQAGVSAFEAVSASTDERVAMGGADGPRVTLRRVTAGYFRTFDCRTTAGRLLTADDARPGAPSVAVVREGLSAPAGRLDLGHAIRLGQHDYAIVGVLSEDCWFPAPGSTDVWVPLSVDRDGVPAAPSLTVTVRLPPAHEATVDLAQAQVAAVGARLSQAGPPTVDSLRRLTLITLEADVGKRLGMGTLAFLGPAVVVLLIACGNVANLLLARGGRRQREMAVRAALGATRRRLVGERLAEGAVLAGVGGGLGLALAVAGVRLLRFWLATDEQTRSLVDRVDIGAPVLLFALAVTVAVPFVFGFVPALSASRPDLTRALHQATGGDRRRRGPYGGRDLLVIVEIGLAVVLVVTAGIFSRFFSQLGNVDWGFDPTKVLAVELSFDASASEHPADADRLAAIVDAIERVAGVSAAAAGPVPGLRAPGEREPIEFEGCAAGATVRAMTLAVGPHYFSTLALPLRLGRAIGEADRSGTPGVAVISARHGEACWPGRNPIGRRLRLGGGPSSAWLTIVGVAHDTMTTRALEDAPQPVYVPYAQRGRVPRDVLVRVEGERLALLDDIRAAVRRADATQPVDGVRRLDEELRRRIGQASMIVSILGCFGAFALALGALGVFSVMSYSVAERTREFGIRLALGSSRQQVLRLVLGRAVTIVGVGAAVSLVGTLAVAHAGMPEITDVAAGDPILWMSVCSLLAAVALAASVVPAQRAMRVEPAEALRAE